jgi:hypothetical protein
MRALATLPVVLALSGCNLAIGLGDYTYQDTPPPNPSGETVWSHVYGDPGHFTAPFSIDVGTEGVVFVAGCSGTGDRNQDNLCTDVANVAVDALESSGAAKWKQRFDAGGDKGVGMGVAATPVGPFVGGYFKGQLTVGPTVLMDPASGEVFLAHLAPATGVSQLASAYGDKVQGQAASRIRQLPPAIS